MGTRQARNTAVKPESDSMCPVVACKDLLRWVVAETAEFHQILASAVVGRHVRLGFGGGRFDYGRHRRLINLRGRLLFGLFLFSAASVFVSHGDSLPQVGRQLPEGGRRRENQPRSPEDADRPGKRRFARNRPTRRRTTLALSDHSKICAHYRLHRAAPPSLD
jgi:hypothetical protein